VLKALVGGAAVGLSCRCRFVSGFGRVGAGGGGGAERGARLAGGECVWGVGFRDVPRCGEASGGGPLRW